jgi:alpha-N-acetylglucosamine transferase
MKCAYVALIYGDTVYFVGALTLAYSLKKRAPKWPVIAMITADVPKEQQKMLAAVYDEVRIIEHMPYHPSAIDDKNGRFQHVFTKLRCLEMEEFDKVLILDIDMIVMRNIDHLFEELPTPAACVRSLKTPHGKAIKPGTMINAGTMLIKPDAGEYKRLERILQNPPRQYQGLRYPEQQFISREWNWYAMHYKYNYPPAMEGYVSTSLRLPDGDVYIAHFGSRLKPWKIYYDPDHFKPTDPHLIHWHDKWFALFERLSEKLKEKFGKSPLEITKLERAWKYSDEAEWAAKQTALAEKKKQTALAEKK